MSEGRYFYTHKHGYLIEASPTWGIGLALCHFEESASLQIMPLFGNIFIKLPKFFWREPEEFMSSYGFSWHWDNHDKGHAIHFNWGSKCKIIYLPWGYTFIRHDILLSNNQWWRCHSKGIRNGSRWDCPDKFKETHPYTYVLENGEVQHRNATISVGEREWRQKWLKWIPWFAKVRRSIDVEFDKEVGERTGSWKGGCVGCGYDLRKGETPLECLRRMERERKF